MIVTATADPDAAAITAIAATRGWNCRVAVRGGPTPAGWSVAIVAVDDAGALVRLRGVAGGAILALGDADWIATHDAGALGYDQAIDRARLERDLPGAIADWCHAERLATIERLAAAFGTAPVAGLLDGLRALLEDALRHAGDDAALMAEAHRIAGLAGTLGFAALGRAWLRVAQGEGPITDATRRATAHALVTLMQAKTNCRSFTAF